MSTVLTVESISKQFHLRGRPATLGELVTRWLRGRHEGARTLWALRDVSFAVEQGLVFGIIGHNGAGKSTLLRLLCGLGRPTSGRIRRMGLVSGLLELGGGFHQDLTGRENILTAGLLNGLTKRQVQAGEEEIIAFAELEKFIDQPIRTYSSGMYLRLAFAVAMHFDPDVLILDEVLAVGDARFQQKCLERLAAFRKAGNTLIIASHDTEQIRNLCDEVLVLEEGRVAMLGDPASAVQCYTDLMRQRTERRAAQLAGGAASLSLVVEQGSRQGTQEATIDAVHLYDAQGQLVESLHSGNGLTIELEYRLTKPIPDMALTLGVYSETHVKCFEALIPSTRAVFGPLTDRSILSCHLPQLPLLTGCYYINVGFYPPDWNYVYDYHWQMHPLRIVGGAETLCEVSGVVSLRPVWSVLTQRRTMEAKKRRRR